MNKPNGYVVGTALLTLALSGCETVASFFPDKQKDYRYSAEIPPLDLPSDLKSDAIKLQDDVHPAAATANAAAQTPSEEAAPAATGTNAETPAKTPEIPQQTLVSWTEGNTRLQLNETYEKAWLLVAKALTHKAVEITDRDRAQGVFFVEYDPEKYQVQDGSLWDEVAFLFGSRDSHELPYRVRVLQNGEHCQVAVTDERDILIVQEPGFSLLKLIYAALEADAQDKVKPAGEEQKQTEGEAQNTAEGQQKSAAESEQTPAAESESKANDSEKAAQPQSGPEPSSPATAQ